MAGFTQEQMLRLQGNKNVAHVSDCNVTFSSEFKQYAYEQRKLGRPLREIFQEQGIDPEILGSKRIDNFSAALRRLGQRGTGFEDGRSINGKKAIAAEKLSLEEQVSLLRHELAYTKQEVEFLKKLQMANTEALKEWESKHRPK